MENESIEQYFTPRVPKFYGQLEITFKLTINFNEPQTHANAKNIF